MNAGFVLRVVSVILMLVAFFMALSLGVALLYGETGLLVAFGVPIGATLLFFAATSLAFGRGSRLLSVRSSYFLVALSWLLASALGALPYVVSGCDPGLRRRLLRDDVRLYDNRGFDPERCRSASEGPPVLAVDDPLARRHGDRRAHGGAVPAARHRRSQAGRRRGPGPDGGQGHAAGVELGQDALDHLRDPHGDPGVLLLAGGMDLFDAVPTPLAPSPPADSESGTPASAPTTRPTSTS